MTENSRTAAVIKGQISKFSGIISRELPKPKQKLVREMIYGIQAAKDIKGASGCASVRLGSGHAIHLITQY